MRDQAAKMEAPGVNKTTTKFGGQNKASKCQKAELNQVWTRQISKILGYGHVLHSDVSVNDGPPVWQAVP